MSTNYTTCMSPDDLTRLHNQLVALPDNTVVGLDEETEGLSPAADSVVGIGISWKEGQAVYVPVICPVQNSLGFNADNVVPMLRELRRLRVVSHKALFDLSMLLASFGVEVPFWSCTYLMAMLTGSPLDLKTAESQVFGRDLTEVMDFGDLMKHHFGPRWKALGMNAGNLPIGQTPLSVDSYCCSDADYCRRYYGYLVNKVRDMKVHSIYKIEVSLLSMIRKMNLGGVPVDAKAMVEAAAQVRKRCDANQIRINALAGREVNLNSPAQLSKLLFDDFQLPVIKRSAKTRAPSADKDVLAELQNMHPVVPIILEWREESKLLSDYLEKLPKQIHNGRVFTEFNPIGARTGRITSSGNDNHLGGRDGLPLQCVSKKPFYYSVEMQLDIEKVAAASTEAVRNGGNILESPLEYSVAKNLLPEDASSPCATYTVKKRGSVRGAFRAPKGYVWVRMDLSQIEPRIGASLSQEPVLLEGFARGEDPHAMTAAAAFGVSVEEVMADHRAGGLRGYRKKGKVIGLAISYGMGEEHLAREIQCSPAEAGELLKAYWKKLPRMEEAVRAAQQSLLQQGEVRTFFGRVRRFDGNSGERMDELMRKAWNTRVQGTAADIMKIAMLRVQHTIDTKYSATVETVLTVHDELDFLVREDVLFPAMLDLRRAFEVPVPATWAEIRSEVSYGPSWDEGELTIWEDRDPDTFTSWKDVLPPTVFGLEAA